MVIKMRGEIKKVKIEDIKGHRIKKDLQGKEIPINRVIKRYHNKHKDGSGNFGFTIRVKDDNDETWHTMDGEYNSNGEITILEISNFQYSNRKPLSTESYEAFIGDLERYFKIVKEV